MKDFIRSITPQFLLEWNRQRKKRNRNRELEKQKSSGEGFSKEQLVKQLGEIGIVEGDMLLVHSSLSKIGYLKDGPKTFVEALIEAVGQSGNVLMPTSPNAAYQLDYIREMKAFDVLNSPSKTGAITEFFRTYPGVVRSWHPTEPVSAYGPNAKELVKDHFGELTPYTANSPFRKVSDQGGKILYVGVTLSMAGTNLHTLEDAVDFKYPVYYSEEFDVRIIGDDGKEYQTKTKVHNPEFSKKRRCDDLIPMFIEKGAMKKVKIGEAETLLVEAKRFLEVMIEEYTSKGVTMYTPFGSED